MKKRIVSLILVLVLLLSVADAAFVWKGSANYNDGNNPVISTALPTDPAYTMEKWAYGLNLTAANYGTYYAGQVVIADGYLYATGGGKLHKVDVATGEGSVISESAGSSGNYYDYMVYADGVLIVATQTKLEAFSLTGQSLGSVAGSFGYYHPVQYHDGYVFCNGYIYKLEKSDAVTFTQVGTAAIGGDAFNWSSGAFLDGKFYVAGKTTVYAVDYATNTVIDSYVFDAERTSALQSVSYDAVTGRLFWGTYTATSASKWTERDRAVHSIKLAADGTLDKTSYISGDAGQPTVCTPVISNGRVYLPGQAGNITVLDAGDLSVIYTVEIGGGKIQSTPVVSAADGTTRVYVQAYDGHLYVMTDLGTAGTAVQLAATRNYSGVRYPNAYEQIAVDDSGNLYCYNESGYLFCFAKVECQVPVITADLSTQQVKIAKDSSAAPLTVAASVTDGGTLSYQWQKSTDNKTWTDISGAVDAGYTPATDTEGTAYYRCVITNTLGGKTAKVVSAAANILVKVLSSDASLHVMVNSSNSATSGTPAKAAAGQDGILRVESRTAKTTNLWLGTVSEGTITSFELLQGLAPERSVPGFTSKTSSNAYDGTTYLGYYRSTYYTLPIVAKATVTAEDGVTTATHYIVIDSDAAGQYIVSADGFTADTDTYYSAASGITFTQVGQTVTLTPKTASIGTGEADAAQWSWSSSDVKVAKVDENGRVTSVGGGTATITAALGKITAVCSLTSTAEAHTIHTYADGACSVCGTKEPSALTAYFTLAGQDGKIAVSKDGETELYKTQISVSDADKDGSVTLNDAFITLHSAHSVGGEADFASSGGWMQKLWGVSTYNVGYTVNDAAASSLLTALKRNDEICAFFYRDTVDFSDLYTHFAGDETVTAGQENTFTVSGLSPMSGMAAAPTGAAVRVYDKDKKEVAAMATTVGSDGGFKLNFSEAGTYTVEVSGTCAYTGSVWDASLNGYAPKEFTAAPTIPARMTVEVMPYVKKTVYLSISTKSGTFAVNKNGDEMYRFPVTAEDDSANPDGVINLAEILIAAHEQYHADGASALSGVSVTGSSFITKLWGESNGGNCSYYFNDVYMSGGGTKTGTNGRPFADKLLKTEVEDGDCFYVYSFQATSWSKGDLYTYFDPVSEAAVAGTAKTLTVKSATGYGSNANTLQNASVKVMDINGVEQTVLNTTVGEGGVFAINFPAAGTYTVEVRSNGTNYVTPTRCTVHVTAASTGTGGEQVYISVTDPQGKTYFAKAGFAPNADETAYSLLLRTGLQVQGSSDNQWGGVYVESIEGLGEFSQGNESGWMYRVNGVYPEQSASLYAVTAGDYVEWIYTRKLGGDIGGGYTGSAATDKTEDKTEESQTAKKHPFSDISGHWGESAVQYVWEKGLMNGLTETEFAPELTTSRAMIATILYRLEGEKARAKSGTFRDVAAGSWYTDAIEWAAENGIVTGYGDGTFGPEDAITREQMAVILFRYAQFKGLAAVTLEENLHFTDADEVSSYAVTAMNWAVGQELITGMTDGTLLPQGTATRAQIAAIFMRYLSK